LGVVGGEDVVVEVLCWMRPWKIAARRSWQWVERVMPERWRRRVVRRGADAGEVGDARAGVVGRGGFC